SALARILGPLSGTYLFKLNLTLPYLVGGGLMALGLFCVWLLGRRPKV
ncbi:MAG: hypothetical protein JWM11_2458, partial [Planctomycetaceae bacterium]|nr:hypothetical protein [Planctomycetaceae bacterium]